MIKTLLVGAALGFIGKKLYDQGTLGSYIGRPQNKLREHSRQGRAAAPADIPKASDQQPDLAF